MKSKLIAFYAKSPVWLQNTGCTVEGVRLKHLRYGGSFHKYLEWIEGNQWLSRSELENQQDESLRQLVSYSYSHVPYYRELFDQLKLRPTDIQSRADLAKLPILTKAEARANYPKLLTDAIPRKQFIVHGTSGSTGSPLPLACNAETIQKDWAHMWRAHRRFGVAVGSRGAHFPGKVIVPARQNRPPFWRWNAFGNQKIFSVIHIGSETIDAYLEELERWHADYWYGYPSAMALLCKYAASVGKTCHIPPKAVFAGSERVTPAIRASIETVAKCPVMAGYGSREHVCRMMECEKGSYHLDTEYGIAECLGDDNQPAKRGRLIATGFANKVMPFIRYDTGDTAEWSDEACACGRQSAVIADILGRVEDCIVIPDGRMIGHLPMSHVVTPNVLESQVYQPNQYTIVMRVVKGPSYTSDDDGKIETGLRDVVGLDMKIQIQHVDVLPRSANGKLRLVMSDVRSAMS